MDTRKLRRWRRWARRHENLTALGAVAVVAAAVWVANHVERALIWAAAASAAAVVLLLLARWVRSALVRAREVRIVAATDLASVDRMHGPEFEEHVARLLRAHGYTRVHVVGGGNDGGVDVRAQTPDGRALAVQCKRWKRAVPPEQVRAFLGALGGGHRGYVGMFVATNGFTGAAAREARGAMVLVDRHALALWMSGSRAPTLPAAR